MVVFPAEQRSSLLITCLERCKPVFKRKTVKMGKTCNKY